MTLQIVVLAAGLGTRLGRPHPKPLTPLSSGQSIIRRAVDSFRATWDDVAITAVVGFKLDLVIEAMPDICFVYNELYDSTNTSKSLLKALRLSQSGGVLWLNGDVVFDPAVLPVLAACIEEDRSFVCVNTSSVAEEEVKYTLDDDGYVRELSKVVSEPLGEAVGINYVSAADKAALIAGLDECGENDYFERAVELSRERSGVRFAPVDLSEHFVVEVDFDEDLARANDFTGSRGRSE